MKQTKKIIFTDLDGTLLDRNYSFKKAKKALKIIKERDIPLILCTSKTKEEVEIYKRRLDINEPFIIESGGAIYIPTDYFKFDYDFSYSDKNYKVIKLGGDIEKLRKTINKIKKEVKIKVLSDLSAKEISTLTNLSVKEAKLIKKHKYELALIFDKKHEKVVKKTIEKDGFNFRKGKFYYIKKSNKGKAVKILISLFKKKYGSIQTYAIGDSQNDSDMFDAVDEAFVVKNPDMGYFSNKYKKLGGVGPPGWSKGIFKIIKE